MDARELKKIVQIMNDNDLVEVEIEEEGKRLRVRKQEHGGPPLVAAAAAAAPAPAAAAESAPAAETPAEEPGVHVITSPMVGTFYRAPSPDAEPYVDVGVRVDAESVVCILEAMKVMNEIKAECAGQIVDICVQNGEAVEFGQALFKVRN